MFNLKALSIGMLSVLLTAGCSLPQIIVLHDPLSAEEHFQLGSIYDAKGQFDLAAEQYRLATRRDKKHIKAWTLLGDLSYRRKDYDEAESAYKKVLRLQPDSGDVRNNLAWVYLEQGRKLKKARELVMEALSLRPDQRHYYLDTLGVVLLRLGSVQEAVAALRESVGGLQQDNPEVLAEAYEHLSEAYKAAGDEQASGEALEKRNELLQQLKK